MIDVYGLKNCDTCRRAQKWMTCEGVTFRFHDLRAEPPARPELEDWCRALDWAEILNRRSTTWRNLDPSRRRPLDASHAVDLMMLYPALIKRPLFVFGDGFEPRCAVGFDDATKARLRAAERGDSANVLDF